MKAELPIQASLASQPVSQSLSQPVHTGIIGGPIPPAASVGSRDLDSSLHAWAASTHSEALFCVSGDTG